MSIVISDFAAITGYVGYCLAIGTSSYYLNNQFLNIDKDKKDELNSLKQPSIDFESITKDVNVAYVKTKFYDWKIDNSLKIMNLSEIEKFEQFKKSVNFKFENFFDDMKNLKEYKQSKFFDNIKDISEYFTQQSVLKDSDTSFKTPIDTSYMFQNLNKSETLTEAKPDEIDWKTMFENIDATRFDYNEMLGKTKQKVVEQLKNTNPNDIIFANENVIAIANEINVALNLSDKEKELHKENSDLYQMLLDNKKLYEETIDTINGKFELNKIEEFNVKYFETNKEIIDQIEKNHIKLKELSVDKQDIEIQTLAD